jgi:tetratricopeptide (TPR) repeat protein
MAKRKRLNRRGVVLLVAFGFVGLIGGVWAILASLPQNHAAAAAQARAAIASGNNRLAERYFNEAIGAAKNEPMVRAQYLYRLADMRWTWINSDPSLSQTDRRDLWVGARRNLEAAISDDPDMVEARRLLCELLWRSSSDGDSFRARSDDMTAQAFVSEVSKLLKQAPEDHEAYYRRAMTRGRTAFITHDSKLYEQAADDFAKAIELKKDLVLYWLRLVELHDLMDAPEKAEQTVVAAVEANPDSAELRVYYAMRLSRLNRTRDAEEQIQEAIKRAPNDPTGKMAQAEYYSRRNQIPEALKALSEAKQIDPADARPYLLGAQLLQGARKLDEAIDELRRGREVVNARLTSGPATRGAGQQRLDIQRLRMDFMLGNYLLDKALKDAQQRAALVAEAKALLEQVSQSIPEAPDTYKLQGRIAMSEGRLPEATEAMRRANEGFGGADRGTLAILINLYQAQNMPTLAEKLVSSLLEKPENRNNIGLLVQKAQFEIESKQYSEAIAHVRQVLDAEPDNTDAKNLVLALTFVNNPNATALPAELEVSWAVTRLILDRASTAWDTAYRDQAISLVESLLAKDPANPTVIAQLVRYYALAGMSDKAQALLEKSMALVADVTARERLAALLELTSAKTPEEQFQIRMKLAEKVPDAHDRLIQKASICGAYNKETQYVEFLNEAMKIKPDSRLAVAGLFNYYLSKRDLDQARKYAQVAKEKNLDEVKGRAFAAQLASAERKFDVAATLLSEAIGERPERLDLRILLGDAYRDGGQNERSEQAYRGALELDRNYEPAVVRLAQLSFRLRRYQEYRSLVNRAYRGGSRDQWVLQQYLRIIEQDAPITAIQERERILAQNPTDLNNILALASLYERFDQPANAEKMFRQVYESSDNKVAGGAGLAGFLARARRGNDLDKLALELLNASDDKAAAYVVYGQALSLYDNAKALAAFDKAVEAAPDKPFPHAARARFMASIGRYKDAADNMAKAIELEPQLKDRFEQYEMVQWRISAMQLDDASQHIARMLGANPQDLLASILKAAVAIARKDYQAAEDIYAALIRAHPTVPEPLIRRAQLHRLRGDNERAKVDLEAAARLSEANETSVMLADVYVTLNEHDKARTTYSEVINRSPGYEPAVRGLAELFLRQSNYRALEAMLPGARKAFPKDPAYLVYEARVSESRNDHARRIASLQEALRLDPSYEPAIRAYLETLVALKQFDLLKSAVAEYGQAPGAKPLALASEAVVVAQQDASAADKLFAEALKTARQDQFTYIIGMLKAAYGERQALQRSSDWLSARNDHWALPYELAIACDGLGDYTGAEQLLQASLRLATAPDDRAHVQALLGTVYLQMHERGLRNEDYPAKAEQALLAAFQQLPSDIRVVNNLAYLYVNDLGKPASALPYAERAAKQVPSASVLDTYGWTLAQLGRLEDAERELLRALQLDDRLSYARYHLAWVLEKRGLKTEAIKQYRQGLASVQKDDPLYKELAEGLQRLQR